MNQNSRIFVAGHRGLVGATLTRKLREQGYSNLLLKPRAELDLLDQQAVRAFFEANSIDYVFVAAAKVGGILANSAAPVDFLYENIVIAMNIIRSAADTGVKKLLYLGSSCIYPRMAPQPIVEESLLTSELEPTNEGYALAKIAGLKLCDYYQRQHGRCFISAMPTNLYGPGDNFHPTSSHVVPGLMRRFHEAKERGTPEVTVWGTGTPLREFLHVEDLADALCVLMERYEGPGTVNIGSGQEVTIARLAEIIATAVGYTGRILFDPSKPDGTPRKALDLTKSRALGWAAKIPLEVGMRTAYQWALEHHVFA